MWKTMVLALSLIVAAGGCSREPASSPAPNFPQEYSPHVADHVFEAWKAAGFEAGWIKVNDGDGSVVYQTTTTGAPSEIPAFMAWGRRVEDLSALPDPGIPFGMRLGDGELTDDDLAGLKQLKNLRVLDLSENPLRDPALKHIARLKGLEVLELNQTGITDDGLKELAVLKSLRSLRVGYCKLTGSGLKDLENLETLTVLSLPRCELTDVGLNGVGRLKSLRTLELASNFGIKDRGLIELAGLSNLRTLVLTSTDVTDMGIQHLQRALPECKIVR
jgi:hypothetical protein